MPKAATGRGKNAKPVAEPRLGIFWLVNGKLLIDSAPLSKCEQYGDHLNYPGSHIDVWERWRRTAKVPPESEYEEFPRGRVAYHAKPEHFTLFADKCILKHKDLITAIKSELRLPKKTALGTDPHYRCFQCLHGTEDDEE